MKTVLKLLTALATIAGIVYVVATYGDKIVAWAKKVWAAMPKCPCCQEAEPAEEAVVEEAPAEEVAEEAPVEEEPVAEEVVVEETAPVAEEADFAE